MSKLQSKEYLSVTAIAGLTGINREKLQMYIRNHKQCIDCVISGKRIKAHESELDKLKELHELYGKGLNAVQVQEILKGTALPFQILAGLVHFPSEF